MKLQTYLHIKGKWRDGRATGGTEDVLASSFSSQLKGIG